MDPLTHALVNLGGGFITAAVLFVLLRDQLRAHREEMAAERERADVNLLATLTKLDKLTDAFELARCRYSGHCDFQVPQRRPPESQAP